MDGPKRRRTDFRLFKDEESKLSSQTPRLPKPIEAKSRHLGFGGLQELFELRGNGDHLVFVEVEQDDTHSGHADDRVEGAVGDFEADVDAVAVHLADADIDDEHIVGKGFGAEIHREIGHHHAQSKDIFLGESQTREILQAGLVQYVQHRLAVEVAGVVEVAETHAFFHSEAEIIGRIKLDSGHGGAP